MKLDVVFTPAGLVAGDVAGRTVFVVDVLRATTTMCAALHHGARAVIPAASADEAIKVAQSIGTDDVLLAGERNCLPIPGFQLGNSPREMTPATVRGKLIVMTTTNGTRALLATSGAAAVHPAAGVNITVAGDRAREVWERDRDLLVICAGRENNFSLDDAYCAGRLVLAALGGRRMRRGLNDAALGALDLVRRYGERWERALSASRAGRDLTRLGLRDDLIDAARKDAYPVLAQYHDRRVTVAAGAPA